MSRGWWADHRPAHLRPVVGWWAYHYPRLTFYRPGQCPQCHTRGAHKMDCTHRRKPMPIWAAFVAALWVGAVNFAIGYILAATGLPNTAGVIGYLAVAFIVAMSFNVLMYRVYRDWQRVR